MSYSKSRPVSTVANSTLLAALLCASLSLQAQNAQVVPSRAQQPPDTKPADQPPAQSVSIVGKNRAVWTYRLPILPAQQPYPQQVRYGVLSQLSQYKSRLLARLQENNKSAIQPANRAANADATATPPSRTLPSPLDSPPFPSTDWVVPVIGAPDTTPDYPLQKALFGDALKQSRIKVYGWLDAGFVLSNSKNTLSPYSYNVLPNHPVLDQFVLRIERVPDTVQTDHVDWGFRLSNVFGIDYRTTYAKGWFSDQSIKHNNLYGYDPVEAYGLIYVPKVAQGMVIQIGRYISPPDIEAQLATSNYLYSHSLMFTADPFTYTGINAQIKLNRQWTIEVGVQAGNDMAPWQNSAQINGEIMLGWQSPSNNDSLWFGVDSFGDGHYKNGHDNLQIVTATWGHKFNKLWHMQTEGYYEFQYDAALGGNAIDGPVEPYGGGGGQGKIIPGRSFAIGAVHYLMYRINDRDFLTLRNDFLDDHQGQRTGFRNIYTSHTFGYSHYLGPLTVIRPEIRYEHAYNNPAYDNGLRKEQYTFGVDIIQRF